MEIDLSQFHQIFFEESFEGLDSMEQELLNLEEDSDRENINTIFRGAHSIKGGSATFNFKEVAEFTHILETLLDEMREGTRAVTRDVVDLLLKSVDCLRGMLTRIQNNEPVGEQHLILINSFNELIKHDAGDSELSASLPSSDTTIEPATSQQALGLWSIDFKPEHYILETGNEPLRMFRELKAFGLLTVEAKVELIPDFDEIKPESCYLAWHLTLDSDISMDEIKDVFEWVEDDCKLVIERSPSQNVGDQPTNSSLQNSTDTSIKLAGNESDANKIESQNAGSIASAQESNQNLVSMNAGAESEEKIIKKNSSSASIRVGIDKVDTLIDLVGELVITQSMLGELGENFTMSKLNLLIAGLSELEQNTRELQESVMRIRMLPIGFVFNRLPRMVRDLSAQLGKKIILDIKGESTELDKTVMEQVGDPLTHLVRNAVDHGIETVEKRLKNNKSEDGRLTLNAFHQGGNIVIQVSDDGGGINPEVIYKKAIEKGMIKEGIELPKEQILALIMEPGFSTAEVVSDVSGRGVGMDVVKRNINNLGGTVDIDSELGIGTTFTIRLPLTLAILDGQLVKVADEVFILPLMSIIESIPLSQVEITCIAGDIQVYKLHDDYIPIINLRDEFEIEHQLSTTNDGLLAIVEGENRKIAIRIDELLGQQQVVIKSLESHYKSIQGVSGATILGDGRVSLILDIVGLAKRASVRANSKRVKVA